MPNPTIKCPHCGRDIEVTEVLENSIRESIRSELEVDLVKKEQEFAKQQVTFKQKEKELASKLESIDEEVAEKVKARQKLIAEVERKKILAEQAEQTKILQDELAEKSRKLSEANKKELELRRQQQKLEEEKANIELTVQRQLDEERKKIVEEAGKKAIEAQQLKIREKDDLIKSLEGKINDLQRRIEVGSQEAQGEALEGTLLDLLNQTFPFDKFEEVKKGVHGADILQIVRNDSTQECGSILWESKNTQSFNKNWIEKLKADQQDAGADLAVLASVVLPSGIQYFEHIDDIWVTDYRMAVNLGTALRQLLINVARHKLIRKHQDGMKDIIYNYVTGKEFAMHIKAIVSAFSIMKIELDKEKSAMQKIWKNREKQIDTVIQNIVGIRGSIEGYVGGHNLPQVESLMLGPATNEEEINDEDEGTEKLPKDDALF